jgi:hypothetical protein
MSSRSWPTSRGTFAGTSGFRAIPVDIPAILGSLQIPASAAPTAPVLLNALLGQEVEVTLDSIIPGGLVLSLPDGSQFQAQGTLPFPVGSALTLTAAPLPEGAGVRLQVMRATPPPSPALLAPLVFGEAKQLLARIQSEEATRPLAILLQSFLQSGKAAAERPAAWSTWMKEVIKALSDPATSPAESTFHRLQAKEGTGWYELPLPWAPGAEPMRIWIEADRDPSSGGDEPVHRVFLSIPFSALGEVRLGLEQRSSGLKVRLWLQDPQQLSAIRQELEAELASLGRPVVLQVFALPTGAPDLRALAGANSLQAMG